MDIAPSRSAVTEDSGTAPIACRLCEGAAHFVFARDAEDGDLVRCYECTRCGSLQTEVPYWIDALYASSSGASNLGLDTGAVERCILARVAIALLWRLGDFRLRHDKLLDWGGGPGLLTRMVRDVGIDAYLYDRYSPNHYAVGFTRSEGESYSFVTSFEVFEHFAQPAMDLEPIFAMAPRFLLISTWLYERQGPDWNYLGPPKSEHVFFYSPKAIDWIAARYGYSVLRLPRHTTLFHKSPLSRTRRFLATLLLRDAHLAQVAFALKRKWSLVADDEATIKQRLARSAGTP